MRFLLILTLLFMPLLSLAAIDSDLPARSIDTELLYSCINDVAPESVQNDCLETVGLTSFVDIKLLSRNGLYVGEWSALVVDSDEWGAKAVLLYANKDQEDMPDIEGDIRPRLIEPCPPDTLGPDGPSRGGSADGTPSFGGDYDGPCFF